jgi:hypothetical protein
MGGVSWGRGSSNFHGASYGSGQNLGNGPGSSSQWRLSEARQICPSSFWEVM